MCVQKVLLGEGGTAAAGIGRGLFGGDCFVSRFKTSIVLCSVAKGSDFSLAGIR